MDNYLSAALRHDSCSEQSRYGSFAFKSYDIMILVRNVIMTAQRNCFWGNSLKTLKSKFFFVKED